MKKNNARRSFRFTRSAGSSSRARPDGRKSIAATTPLSKTTKKSWPTTSSTSRTSPSASTSTSSSPPSRSCCSAAAVARPSTEWRLSRRIYETDLSAVGATFGHRVRRHHLLFHYCFVLLTFLLVEFTELVPHFVNLRAHYLVALFAEETPGGRAGAHAGGRSGESIGLAKFRLLVGLSQDRVGFGIEISAGRETELLLKLGTFLDAGVVDGVGLVWRVFPRFQLRGFHLLDAAVG